MATGTPPIDLSEEQRRMLVDLAEKAGKPWEEVYRDALQNYRLPSRKQNSQETTQSFFDSMKEVIGIVKDTPNDLSTNPKHMEGFGR